MVKEGAMQDVDSVIGLHLISNYTLGRVGVRAGTVFASADKFVLTVQGKGGHAAMPHEAVDPIVVAANIITTLQTLISRETSPFSPAVVTIGTIHAGTAFNIIPERAELQGNKKPLRVILRLNKNGKVRYNYLQLTGTYKALMSL